MVSAHMDEVGLMVISATDEGLLHVRPIGGIDPRVLVSKRVKVGYAVPARDGKSAQEPLSGVIGAMAIHQQTAEDRKRVLPIDQLYVDIGAKDKDEALEKGPGRLRPSPSTLPSRLSARGGFWRALWTTASAATTCCACSPVTRMAMWILCSPARRRSAAAARRGAAFRLMPDIGLALEGNHRQRHGRYARRASRVAAWGAGHDGQLHG